MVQLTLPQPSELLSEKSEQPSESLRIVPQSQHKGAQCSQQPTGSGLSGVRDVHAAFCPPNSSVQCDIKGLTLSQPRNSSAPIAQETPPTASAPLETLELPQLTRCDTKCPAQPFTANSTGSFLGLIGPACPPFAFQHQDEKCMRVAPEELK